MQISLDLFGVDIPSSEEALQFIKQLCVNQQESHKKRFITYVHVTTVTDKENVERVSDGIDHISMPPTRMIIWFV